MALRTHWDALPLNLRSWVEKELGGSVVSANSQASGFSVGTADRLTTAEGRRGFVKALQRERNPPGFELHRREVRVMSAMPSAVRAPRLLASYDDGQWIALLLEDIEGVAPGQSAGADIDAILDALATLPRVPGDLSTLPWASEDLADDFGGWARILADGAERELPEGARMLLDRMVDASAYVLVAVEGDHLVHLDCRADNLLMDASGTVWIVDWPWAGIGAPWLDALTYLLDVLVRGEPVASSGT
jgi:aminoglycoside phosphotransferase (APT) family kinase protein